MEAQSMTYRPTVPTLRSRRPGSVLLLGACLLALGAMSAQAEEAQQPEEALAFFEELPVVVSVSRLPQRYQDTPASVTVIDRRMIEASGAREIPDLLRLVSGFQVGHTQYLGPRSTVTYHGMSDAFARRMQVLVDGRSVYLPGTGGVDWYQLPLSMEDIERIEVVRGPNGVSYGANAFLGVINIITYHPDAVQGQNLNVANGGGGYKREFFRHAGRYGDLSYRLSLEHRRDHGFEDAYVESSDSLVALHDEKRIKNLSFRGDYRAGVNDFITLNLGSNINEVGDGQRGDALYPPHDNDSQRHSQQLKWKHIVSSSQEIELQLYHILSDLDARYEIAPLSELFAQPPALVEALFGHSDEPIVTDQSMRIARRDVEFQHRLRPLTGLQLVWGAELRDEVVEADGLLGKSPADNRLYRLFLNGEWQFHPRWILNAGAMAEDNELTGTQVSPRIALNYRLSPEHSLRTAYTISYRTPSLLEEYGDYAARFIDGATLNQIWQSAGGLDAEQIHSTEIGLVGASADRRYSYDVRLFREHLRDLISTPTDLDFPEPYNDPTLCALHVGFCESVVFVNDGSADMDGIELQLKLQPTPRFLLSLGYSYVDASGEMLKRLNPTSYRSIAQATPKDTSSLLIAQTWPGQWQTSLGLYHTGEMEYIGGDKTDGVTTADIHIAKDFSWSSGQGKVALTINDILGRYYDFEEAVTPTRRTSLSIGLSF